MIPKARNGLPYLPPLLRVPKSHTEGSTLLLELFALQS